MVDTHCHLYDEAFDTDRDDAVKRAVAVGVGMMLLPGIDSKSHAQQEALAAQYPQYFRQMMGLHPTSVDDNYEAELAIVHDKLFATSADYVGVGEIGLDLYCGGQGNWACRCVCMCARPTTSCSPCCAT